MEGLWYCVNDVDEDKTFTLCILIQLQNADGVLKFGLLMLYKVNKRGFEVLKAMTAPSRMSGIEGFE